MPLSPDKSTLLSVLDWFDQPFQAVGNLARGNPGAAGRHVLDFLADPVDAVLPGNVIPQFSRPEDQVSASQLFGIDRQAHPFLGSLADTVGGAALNPLTYVGFGEGQGLKLAGQTIAGAGKTLDPLTLIAKGARAGIDALPGLEQHMPGLLQGAPTAIANKINNGLQTTRETLGWLNPDASISDLVTRAKGMSGGIADAKSQAIEQMFRGTDPADRQRAFRLINNYDRDAQGRASLLGPDVDTLRMGTWDEQMEELQKRVANAPWSDDQKRTALDLASKALQHERTNYFEAVNDFKGMNPGPAPGMTSNVATRVTDNVEDMGMAPLDYTRRDFDFGNEAQQNVPRGAPNPLASRDLRTSQQLVDFLNQPENLGKPILDEDLASASAQRSAKQARMAQQAVVGDELVNRGLKGDLGPNVQAAVQKVMGAQQSAGAPLAGNAFESLADPRSRTAVSDVIAELGKTNPDDARVLQTAYQGLGKRGGLTQFFADMNRWFKPAAVYGVGYPGKVAAVVRNTIAFPTQLAAEENAGWGQALQQAKRTANTIGYGFGKATDHVFGTDLTQGLVSDNEKAIDAARQQSGARFSKQLDILRSSGRDDLADMLERNVTGSGFASADAMLTPIRDSRKLTKIMDALGLPKGAQDKTYRFLEGGGEAFQGVEDYARSRNFLDLRQKNLAAGMTADEASARAATAVRNALYDYDTVSERQRALSDIIPFAKFSTNAIRQNANFLSRTPAVATTLAGLYGDQPDEPLYPYLQEQAHVRVGNDEKGNPEYASGLGLPVEALNLIPNVTGTSTPRGVGREIERIVGGSAQPIAKTAYTYIAGHDPYFETPAGSYEKLPGDIQGGEAGRLYNLVMGTGLLAPVDTLARQVGKLVDDRTGAGDKALDLLTGANIVSVDPQLALQQQLTNALEQNPDVRQTRDLYIPKDQTDDDTTALLKELARLKVNARKAHSKPQ